MNKKDFLDALRQKTEHKSAEELRKALKGIVRYIPRDFYEEVLLLVTKEKETEAPVEKKDLLASVAEICQNVEAGHYEVLWEYDEGYDYGYWSEEMELVDCNGIGHELKELLLEAMNCVVNKSYSKALQAFGELLSIYIPNEEDDIGIRTLFDNDLIDLDYHEVLSHYAYAALVSLRGEERVQHFYNIVCESYFRLRLSEVSILGEDEIPDRELFAKQWIDYLLQLDLCRREDVLIDALLFRGGTQALEEFTITHGAKYHKTYIDLVQTYMGAQQYDDAARVIQDGLSKISGIHTSRTKLADTLSEIGEITENPAYYRVGLEEAFYSSIDLEHFLKLYALRDEDILAKSIAYMDTQKRDSVDYFYIHFLNGEYRLAWEECCRGKQFFDWNNSKKESLMPMFLALLSGEKKLTPCIKAYIQSRYIGHDFDLFADILTASLRPLSDEEYDTYLSWVKREAIGRTEAIVKSQNRGGYPTASALVVSIGEVLTSRGERDAGIRYIKKYKETYPRHTSFHKCLREDVKLAGFGTIL